MATLNARGKPDNMAAMIKNIDAVADTYSQRYE